MEFQVLSFQKDLDKLQILTFISGFLFQGANNFSFFSNFIDFLYIWIFIKTTLSTEAVVAC